jgi:hypothetical protein
LPLKVKKQLPSNIRQFLRQKAAPRGGFFYGSTFSASRLG